MRRKTSVTRGFLLDLNARKIPVFPGSTRTIWIYIVSLRYKREFVDVEDVRFGREYSQLSDRCFHSLTNLDSDNWLLGRASGR